jgi:monofunctional biosynthetic peptidoglycan transglycosylase
VVTYFLLPVITMKNAKLALVLILIILLIPFVYFLSVPNISNLKKQNPKKTAFMEYREREGKGRKIGIDQRWVPLSNISPYLIKAVLIAEDDKFWRHEGFDYEAIQKALERDLKAKKLKFGGSTISQQLARNLYLTPEKSLLRKVREALITWRLEKVLSKKRILELYLNVVEWGDGIFGIEAASRHYYGKPASELTPLEATRLASVLPSPKKYDPVGSQPYVTARSNDLYKIMIQRGIIAPEYEEMTEENGSTREKEEEEIHPVDTESPDPSFPTGGQTADEGNRNHGDIQEESPDNRPPRGGEDHPD